MVHGLPEFHRRAADDALREVERARQELVASQLMIDQLDALLAEVDLGAAP